MNPPIQFISVRTMWGTRNHLARSNEPTTTLCGWQTYYKRIGGSWFPEEPRGWDHDGNCNRCQKQAGVGP